MLNNEIIKQEIIKNEIVAIIRGIDSTKIVDTVGALIKGGIRSVEITYNHEDEKKQLETLKCISLIKEVYGDKVLLGAGTVITTEQVTNAISVGAEYIISPNVDIEVIKKTKELSKVSIPGAFTPTEMITAYNAGADIVKLFPAGNLGIDYIKALLAPLSHIPVVAVGGINEKNINDFLNVGAKVVGIGSNLVNKEILFSRNYHKITHYAMEYVKLIHNR